MLRQLPLLVVLLVAGAVLTLAVTDMPAFRDAGAPAHRHVASRYIAMAYEETGVPNMVTAILADYRGYDTLGELTVMFAACAAVLSALVGRKQK